jgi:hypothetical protein
MPIPAFRPVLALAAALVIAPHLAAAALYEDPGWDYFFDGDADSYGVAELQALDGAWRHDQADKWDGSAPGEGDGLGGVAALLDGPTTYLRVQDTGNPVDWSFPDPSNRRIWFGHDIEEEHPGAVSVLSNGITLTFRARIASTGVLDDIHPDLQDNEPEFPALTQITPWPAAGKGYNVSDDGQGMFTVQEDGNFAVGFALALDADTWNGNATQPNLPGGLITNNATTSNLPGSDRGRPTGPNAANLVALSDADLLDWHEFWITIVGTDPPGEDFCGAVATLCHEYEIKVYRDGSTTPQTFQARSSIGAEFPGQYFSFGLSSETSFGAVDVDFYGYKLGVVTPVPEPAAGAAALAAIGALGCATRRRRT